MRRSFRTSLALLLPAFLSSQSSASEPDLEPPANGKIRVAVLLGPQAQVIDFAGPWEVFQDVHVLDRGPDMDAMMPFELYTVAESRDPIRATGGMQIVPDYTFEDAPQPRVIVVPALRGSERLREWLRAAAVQADVTMSVCTGSFELAAAGLLHGLRATTHHDFLDRFAEQHPDIPLERGARWVDNGKIATAAGLTSGIDLALHIVQRYFGPGTAQWVADYMEHDSDDWRSGKRSR